MEGEQVLEGESSTFTLASGLPLSVSFGKLMSLSEPQFLLLNMGLISNFEL